MRGRVPTGRLVVSRELHPREVGAKLKSRRVWSPHNNDVEISSEDMQSAETYFDESCMLLLLLPFRL